MQNKKNIVDVGGIKLGNGKVVIQSMTNTKTSDEIATINQINKLDEAGCEIVRVSIPDEQSAIAIKNIIRNVKIPIIGDIHYSQKFVKTALENGISKIRINPLNTSKESIKDIVMLCKDYNAAIRVGVNTGSDTIEREIESLVDKTLDTIKYIEDLDFKNIVVSIKSSDVNKMVKANRILAKKTNYPLHIGLTESGTENLGSVKSMIAIGSLLVDGIGDTIRVSLPGDPINEIEYAKKILRAVGLDNNFLNIIACPTCARTQIDVDNLSKSLENRFKDCKANLKLAVMGCAVNGIGESKGADFGVCGGKEKSVIFLNGEKIKIVDNKKIEEELVNIANLLIKNRYDK